LGLIICPGKAWNGPLLKHFDQGKGQVLNLSNTVVKRKGKIAQEIGVQLESKVKNEQNFTSSLSAVKESLAGRAQIERRTKNAQTPTF
jgi:hypothetical protein